MLIKVLAPGFYARHDTKTPVKIGIASLILNMVFNLILAYYYGYIGLALATSLSATCNAFLLYYFLSKQGVYQFSKFSIGFTAKCFISSVAMAFVTFWCEQQLIWQSIGLGQQILFLISLLLIAIITYFSLLFILGIRVNTIKNVSFAKKSL